MNKLKKYLIENKIRAIEFAKMCNVSPSTISMIANDKGGLSLDLAFKIEELTNYQVKVEDFKKPKKEVFNG